MSSRLADDSALREMVCPVVEGEHCNGIGVVSGLVAGQKEPTRCRPNAKRLKIIAAYHFDPDLFGAVVPGDSDTCRRGSGQPAKDLVVSTQVLVHRVRKIMVLTGAVSTLRFRVPFFAPGITEHHESAWILDRKGAQQCLVQQGEDGRIRANGQGEGEDRRDGKARRAHDLAQGKTKIIRETCHEVPSPRLD